MDLIKKEVEDYIGKVCDHCGKKNYLIIGSQKSINELKGFICNAEFRVVAETSLPCSNNIYIIPLNENLTAEETLIDIEALKNAICHHLMR